MLKIWLKEKFLSFGKLCLPSIISIMERTTGKILFVLVLVCLLFSSCNQDILHTHEFDNGVVTLEPTCESVGIKTYTCQCGEEKLVVLAKLEHTAGQVQSTKSTCAKEGKDTTTCTLCGKVLTSETKDLLEHEWNEGVVVNEATCASIGSKKFTCKNCGAEKLETTAKLEHVESEEKTRDATCTQKGGTYTECTVCGEIISEGDVPALDHEWNDGVVVEVATCQSIGSKKFTCTRTGCGAEKLETTAKVDHNESSQKTKAATCTENGAVYTECTVCGKVLSTVSETNALGHSWNDGVVVEAATCQSIGSKKFTCTRCGAEKLETTAKLEHVASSQKTKDATCTEKGGTYTECTLCGEVISTDSETEALGHDWGTGTVVNAATCTSIGSKEFTCSRCREKKIEVISKLAHTESAQKTKAATCTEKGEVYTECVTCGKYMNHVSDIDALGHEWNAGVVVEEATCHSIGSKKFTCTRTGCGAEKLETTAKLNHVPATTSTLATCTVNGKEEIKCTLCDEVINTTVLKAQGHTWVFKERTLEPTCENEGTEVYKCSVCNEEETRSVAKLGHSFTGKVETIPATCTAEGSKFGHCTRCDQTSYESIAKIAHTENEGVVTTAPTCTATGIKTYSCSVCGAETKTEVVAATGHTENEGEVTTQPTCTATGIKTYSCSVCGTALRTEVLETTAHDLQETSRTTGTCTVAEVINYKCSRCTYTSQTTGTTNLSNHSGETEWKVTTSAKYFTKGTETKYCKSCNQSLAETREITCKDLTGFWEGTATTASVENIYTVSFANGQLTLGKGTVGYYDYQEQAACAYTVSDSGVAYTYESSPIVLAKVSENENNTGAVDDKITLTIDGVNVELTRKTTSAHTHTYSSTWEAIETKSGDYIVSVGHVKKMLCTEHTTFDSPEQHSYVGSETCTVCGASKYYFVQQKEVLQDGGTMTSLLCLIKKGDSFTLPALPSGYVTWSYNGTAYNAGSSITPESDLLLTTNANTASSSGTVIVAYTHKCDTHNIGYEPDSEYSNMCPSCFASSTPEVGDILKYGTYPANYTGSAGTSVAAGTDYAGKDITWKVLSVDSENNRALVVSEKILFYMKQITAAQRTDKAADTYYTKYTYTWSGSDINTYLNGSFLTDYGLSGVSMASVEHTTEAGAGIGVTTQSAETTSEKVFLLSKTDASTYFTSNSDRIAYDLSGSAQTGWWLRSPSQATGSSYKVYNVVFVQASGNVFTEGNYLCLYYGVRPAMWVNY
jgi:hypothetical protein